jgi:hypothetical protein
MEGFDASPALNFDQAMRQLCGHGRVAVKSDDEAFKRQVGKSLHFTVAAELPPLIIVPAEKSLPQDFS